MNGESESTVILFPDFQKLKEEVDKLKTELSMLMLERDELVFTVCKNIQTQYMLEMGGLEYKAYKAQCAALRLKRKIEMIQSKKNRQEMINISVIEQALDTEFSEYQHKLDEQVNQINKAIERKNARKLSEEEARELKKSYRAIVKSLHPDISPNVTEEGIKLLDNAVKAYKNGDLALIKLISQIAVNHLPDENHQDVMSDLALQKKRLIESAKKIREDMEKIKSEFPYTVKSILEDPEKLEKRKAETENIISQYNDMISVYKAKIDEMLG